ncbi:ATP-binding protein [Desulfofundulus salinus]|uniref:STAS domain-containing protein n=1 Tax=Desulfofundulus salinus TaxID=2419843 RepID=A0A494WSC6_9FIRM|nr:ATP-binding protein [Desulfofundulus salinum]RKO65751.1 hypothetical protein D7024_01390 [Desulfofundulus salinum]
MGKNELIIPLPTVLSVDSLCEIDFASFWNARYNPVGKIVFDFSPIDFVRPAGLVSIVSLMKLSKYLKVADQYYLREPKDDNVKQYLKRMGFYEQFRIIKETVSPKVESSSLCELREVKDELEAYKLTSQLTRIVKEQVQLEEKMMRAISHALGEIIDNIFHHSNSPINGFVCAQTYKGAGEIEIAVADCGIGIKESLKGNPIYRKIRDDEEAITTAVGKRVTGKPHTNTGQGLFICRRFIKENFGRMDIISGSAQYTLRNTDAHVKCYPFWQGTVVSLVFNLKHPIDPKRILDSEFPMDAELDDLFGETDEK